MGVGWFDVEDEADEDVVSSCYYCFEEGGEGSGTDGEVG
jgi:hypothetical protein